MSIAWWPTADERLTHTIRLEEALDIIDAVRSDLPIGGVARDRADAAHHDISELMRGLR